MKKSIPSTIKHLNCRCKIVIGPFGPHKRKIVCSDHNDAFVQWVPKDFEHPDWPDQLDEFILERVFNRIKKNLADNGTIFDFIKYSEFKTSQRILDILKNLNFKGNSNVNKTK